MNLRRIRRRVRAALAPLKAAAAAAAERAGRLWHSVAEIPGRLREDFRAWTGEKRVQFHRWVRRSAVNRLTYSRRRELLRRQRESLTRRVKRHQSALRILREQYALSGALVFLLISLVVCVPLVVSVTYTPGYLVTANGEVVGVVRSQEEFQSLMDEVEETASEILDEDYQLDLDIGYTRALTDRGGFTDHQSMKVFLMDQIGEVMMRYLLHVDGNVVGAAAQLSDLEALLDEVKAPYVTDATLKSGFVQEVKISYEYIPSNVNQDLNQIREVLNSDSEGESIYTVVRGDTYAGISKHHNMKLSQLMDLNPQASLDRLMPGDELVVKKAIPFLSVWTDDQITYTEPIPCPVENREDDSMYQGITRVLEQGTEGESQVTASVHYVDGEETGRTVLITETLREPTVTVQAVGTKERPKTMPTGTYRWPISGRINSSFGYRSIFGGRRFHSGIDIAASYGATIVAADGGTVTYAGWKSGYGNVVIISHGGGVETYYAHNSSLLVSAGTAVYKGQPIARAGSTGRATGVHCHFEIRINGTAVNPRPYLP